MAIVEVNHKTLRTLADEIDAQCEVQIKQMNSADTAVRDMLRSDWVSADATSFLQKWEGIDSDDAIATQLYQSMKNYAEALRACADAYKKAHEDIYNASVLLPR